MSVRLISVFAITVLSLGLSTGAVCAADGAADAEQMTECYGVYDAMVGLIAAGAVPAAEKAHAEEQRNKAEAQAIALYKSEGLNEELARQQLAGRAIFMRSEVRELEAPSGIYSTDDVRKMAADCDGLLGG